MGMSYLIDTHIFLWWLFDDPKLHTECRDIIRQLKDEEDCYTLGSRLFEEWVVQEDFVKN